MPEIDKLDVLLEFLIKNKIDINLLLFICFKYFTDKKKFNHVIDIPDDNNVIHTYKVELINTCPIEEFENEEGRIIDFDDRRERTKKSSLLH